MIDDNEQDYDYGCPRCGEPGGDDWGPSFCCKDCSECGGSGYVPDQMGRAGRAKRCPACAGRGWVKR